MISSTDSSNIKVLDIINNLLYLFIFSISLNPLLTYLFKISSIHFIAAFGILLISISVIISRGYVIKSSSTKLIIIYMILVILNLIFGYTSTTFFLQGVVYRLLYPMLFMFYFFTINKKDSVDHIGYMFIKVISINTIIICFFGLIEKINPTLVHKFYGNDLTVHLKLIINNEVSSRLVSLSGNPINLGFYMVIGIASSITIILINLKGSKSIVLFHSMILPLYLYVMFLTYSRSAVLLTGVVTITLMLIFYKNINIKGRIMLVLSLLIILVIFSNQLDKAESLTTRLNTMSLESYLQNTRFDRAYTGFTEGTNFFELLFGHGIIEMNNSASYVFELGYASILYETGLVSLIMLMFLFIGSIYYGLKIIKVSINRKERYIMAFYISMITSALAGLTVQDVYMQLPYSAVLWFSTLYIIQKKSINFER